MPVNRVKDIVWWFFRPFSPSGNRYWKIVLLCFLAASTFWLLNALNKSYTTRISYPVRFNYNREALIPIRPLPEEVVINVTGQGWRLLRKSLGIEVKPAEINLRNLPAATYLTGTSLRPTIIGMLDGLLLNFVVTDTLFFRFDYRSERTIPIDVDTTGTGPAENHVILPPVQVEPATVTFRGPASIIDSLPEPYVVRLPPRRLSSNFETTVPLEVVVNRELVKANVAEVQVRLEVSPLVQEELQVEPGLVNFPQNQSFVMRPASATVRYSFPRGLGRQINRDLFVVVLDFSRYNAQDSTIVPTLVEAPPHVRRLSIVPERFKVFFQEDGKSNE
ncbi:hypothetical protein BH24BAC1_BH24BAC1_12550 [soil metagenome]